MHPEQYPSRPGYLPIPFHFLHPPQSLSLPWPMFPSAHPNLPSYQPKSVPAPSHPVQPRRNPSRQELYTAVHARLSLPSPTLLSSIPSYTTLVLSRPPCLPISRQTRLRPFWLIKEFSIPCVVVHYRSIRILAGAWKAERGDSDVEPGRWLSHLQHLESTVPYQLRHHDETQEAEMWSIVTGHGRRC
jgi:hypothetical protein